MDTSQTVRQGPLKKNGPEGACLFLLVGNSGSGKDTLIGEVLKRWPKQLPPLMSPRRYITRPAHPSEPYLAVTGDRFGGMLKRGCFCLSWQSYGLEYALPVKVNAYLKRGWPVLANVSRAIIPQARSRFSRLKVVFVHVPLSLSLDRMRRRGRENCHSQEFRQRVLRAERNPCLAGADLILDNSGAVHTAADQLREYIASHTGFENVKYQKVDQVKGSMIEPITQKKA